MKVIPALIALALVLSGCAAAAGQAALPAGITVSVFQNRFDYSLRQLELKVTNGTNAAITVTSAAFASTRFATPATWDSPQLVPDGSARDLKVQLTDPVCDTAPPKDSVVIEFTLEDGTSGTATVIPTDEQGRVDAINEEDCLGVSVATIAAITAPASIQWAAGAHAPASLGISVVPTGAKGSLTLHYAKGTVLFSLIDAATGQPHDVPLDRVVDANTGASVIPLALVPARCDPHAIEEDKRGTFFPLDVETGDGRSGTIYVAVDDDVRRSLYEFYAGYCGLP